MSASGFTPILIYGSTTASAVPLAANLTTSSAGVELAVNAADGKLFYKDAGGTVQVLAGKGGTGVVAGSNTQVQFNNNGVFGASSGLTFDGTTLTANNIKDSALTSGRVTYAGASGLLQDNANLTFNGTTLTANALTVSNAVTLSGGTANGVAYLNGSKVLTTGSALTFDGTTFANTNTIKSITEGAAINATNSGLVAQRSTNDSQLYIGYRTTPDAWVIGATYSSTGAYKPIAFAVNDSEQMRLTSTGLGIGTSSPSTALDVASASGSPIISLTASGAWRYQILTDRSSKTFRIRDQSAGDLDRVILDQSGNLGLGVTPSAWNANDRVIEGYGNSGFMVAANGKVPVFLSSNIFRNTSGQWTYKTDGLGYLFGVAGNGNSSGFQWFIAPSGTAGNAISFTQAMTLDASGRLMLGTTTQQGRLTIDAGAANGAYLTSSVGGSQSDDLKIVRTGGSGGATVAANTWIQLFNTTDNNGSGFQTYQGGTIFWGNVAGAWYERARIDSSGNLLVGTMSVGGNDNGISLSPANKCAVVSHANGTATNTAYVQFYYNGASIGTISQNGTTAVAYNTTSDHRLKNNVTPLTGALNKVQALKPSEFDWLDGRHDDGFIAHELQAVLPNVVTGEKDAVDEDGNPKYQQVDYARIVPTLTAAIQEQQAIIEQLKADVAALKGAA